MKKPVSVWLISLALCAVSFEGLWSLPNVLLSLQTTSQILVAISHIIYVISGFAVVTGIWRSVRSTWIAVIIWGVSGPGAAIGGPLVFSPITAATPRTVIVIAISVLLITMGLLLYVRRITRARI